MTEKKSSDAAEIRGLSEWREKHFEELDANMRVATEIRDNPDSSARDKNEAIKAIARMMGIMGNERPKAPGAATQGKAWPELTEAEHKKLEELLNV